MMPRLRVCLLASLALLPGEVAAESASPRPGEIDRLIKKLDRDESREWRAAAKALERVGGPALPLLRQAVRANGDSDLRLRAAVVARAIEADERGKALATIRSLGGKIHTDSSAEGRPVVRVF